MKDLIGERLKLVRASLKQTQKQFAASIDMPLPSYKDYEGGKRIPGGRALAKLARAGIDARWLLAARPQGNTPIPWARNYE